MIEASVISLIYNNEIVIKSMEQKGVKSLTPITMWPVKIMFFLMKIKIRLTTFVII